MKKLSLIVLGTFLTLTAAQAQVSELDPKLVPQEIIVRVDAKGNHEVFKVASKNEVTNDEAAAQAVAKFVKETNKVQAVVARSELDQVSSQDSWYYYYNPYQSYSYCYGYSYSGYNYNYTPYYNYSYGYYNYYYYRY